MDLERTEELPTQMVTAPLWEAVQGEEVLRDHRQLKLAETGDLEEQYCSSFRRAVF